MDAEELDSAQVERRFPGLRMPAHWAALYNRDAGVLAASKAVGMLLALARARGATLRDRCGVVALVRMHTYWYVVFRTYVPTSRYP